ncbi:MAG TPA: hypothetical protein VIN40_11020 [Candidatus Tyrphobacter sp.]
MPVQFIHHGSLEVYRPGERAYEEAKAYLSRDPVERSLFDRVEHAWGRHFRLTINHRNDDSFDPQSDTIAWDPTSALRTTNGGRQSPALGLGHEIDHAVESPRLEARLSERTNRRYDTVEERRVIAGSERHAARTLGESVRRDHTGRCYRVASPSALSSSARRSPSRALRSALAPRCPASSSDPDCRA